MLADAPGGKPEVMLLATGSEVSLCVAGVRAARRRRASQARVVSMPSWELFEHQRQAYREQVLPPRVAARVSVEQAGTFGWSATSVRGACSA